MATKSIDQLLDLLIDALEERKLARYENEQIDHEPILTTETQDATPPLSDTTDLARRSPLPEGGLGSDFAIEEEILPIKDEVAAPVAETKSNVLVEQVEFVEEIDSAAPHTADELPEHIPMIDNMPRTMVRLFIALLVVVAFANLQLFSLTSLNAVFAGGNSGATTIRFARDGMLLKGDGTSVYLMEDNKRRWITTSEAFTNYGYRWGAIRYVDDDYLEQFVEGEPIYLPMKCPNSPHVFALDVEGSTQRVRRWVSDIETFEAMGFTWGEIDENRCGFLRALPDGEPFPAGVDRPIPSP